MKDSAIVLFSGGQDSTTCLAWALSNFDKVETLGFDYGQRHAVELTCRIPIIDAIKNEFPEWRDKFGKDTVLKLESFRQISKSALIDRMEIEVTSNGFPNSFVPGRNLIFLTYASALAYNGRHNTIVGGMCETDFSGYPDCRAGTIAALQEAICRGLERPIAIAAPLMNLSKAQTWQLTSELGGQRLIDIVVNLTHTCYLGNHEKKNAWGFGCGECPACQLRSKGWSDYLRMKAT